MQRRGQQREHDCGVECHRQQSATGNVKSSSTPSSSTTFLTTRRIILLFALRLFMSTMLQRCADVPDEWWQSTEVAYHNVFGKGHLPWEWNVELRSYVYPLPFDIAFRLLRFAGIDTAFLIWLVPKVIASAIAATIDIQTYRIGCRIDRVMAGRVAVDSGLTVGKMAFIFSVLHWFTGYIGVRTQSNVLEALLVVTAVGQEQFLPFLFFAGFGCAMRMTCVVPLVPFALNIVLRTVRNRGLQGMLKCVLELVLMLAFWLGLTMTIDYVFYGKWTLTPLNFFLFNVLKGHSAIFGTHPWHWYFTAAFPVVVIPFTVLLPLLGTTAMWRHDAVRAAKKPVVLYIVAILFTMSVYSLVPHKELRFIYPVAPLALILAAFVYVHHPWLRSTTSPQRPLPWIFIFMAVVNLGIYLVVSVGYRRGTIDVMTEVRSGSVSATSSPLKSLHILTGCYATPGLSYIHDQVESLRTMDCTPNVTNEETSETAPTERDVFTEHPRAFVQWAYDGVWPDPGSFTDGGEYLSRLQQVVPDGGSWELPEALIAYSYVIDELRSAFLEPHGYRLHKRMYHTFAVFQPHEDYFIEIWKRNA